MLVVSYMPLMNMKSENVLLTESDIEAFAKAAAVSCEMACGKGVLWARNDTLTPVIIFDKGDAIIEHLEMWSERKPEDWFDLHIVELESGKVQFIISPRFMKSIERHARQHPGADVSKARVMFAPLQVTIDKSDSCAEFLENHRAPKVTIGFVDYEYVMLGDPTKLRIDKIANTIDFKLTSVYNSATTAGVLPFIDGKVVRDYGLLDVDIADN